MKEHNEKQCEDRKKIIKAFGNPFPKAENVRQVIWSLAPEDIQKFWTESWHYNIVISERVFGHYDRRCASCAIDCKKDGRCPLPGYKNPTQIIYEERCAPKGCDERKVRGRCPRSCPRYVLTSYSQTISHGLDVALIESLVDQDIDLKTWWPDEEEADEFMSDP